jgi:exonuclease VII large subunit
MITTRHLAALRIFGFCLAPTVFFIGAALFAAHVCPTPTAASERIVHVQAKDEKALRSILEHFQRMSDELAARESRARDSSTENADVYKVARMAYDQCIARVKEELDGKPTEAR